MAFDYKKEYKEFYLPSRKPHLITVPPMNFVTVQGRVTRTTRQGNTKPLWKCCTALLIPSK